jgi:hypothetical protein
MQASRGRSRACLRRASSGNRRGSSGGGLRRWDDRRVPVAVPLSVWQKDQGLAGLRVRSSRRRSGLGHHGGGVFGCGCRHCR